MLEEVTELTARQSIFRALITRAFTDRLGEVHPELDFHRGWNGGWRCRATLPSKARLEFALLRTDRGALLALPVPMPTGWRRRGVQDSLGESWSVGEDDLPVRIALVANDAIIIHDSGTRSSEETLGPTE